jgi:enoyl-CoA hydratase/carnithine racemase
VEVELLLAWEALKIEQHKHSELRTAVGLVCDALGAVKVHPRACSLRSHLEVAFKQARTQVKEALHLGVRHVLVIFRSHYQKINLEALSEGYVDIPEEELDAIDEEVLEPVKTLAAKFKDEIVPLTLEL